MSREDVLRYCHARQKLNDMLRDTKSERQELYDAQRTIGGLLMDSMLRNNITCTTLGDNRFVRVVNQKTGGVRIRTIEEGIGLLSGLRARMTNVLRDDVLPSQWITRKSA